MWWHDVVYDPHASDNEARSAELARARLTDLGAASDLIENVSKLILATRNHWESPTMGDGDYFLDADIAILGAPPDVYDRYAENVRAEYSFAPDALYRAGRSHFLTAAIDRQPLFRKQAFEAVYGAAARANMRRELVQLS